MEITNQGFFIPKKSLTSSLLTTIKTDLIVSPENSFQCILTVKSFKVYKILKDIGVIVPIFYALHVLKISDYKINFREIDGIPAGIPSEIPNEYFKENISLRQGTQQECMDACTAEFCKPFGGGIINLTTGTGKTVIALKLAAFLGKKTLIILNKRDLIEQWKREIIKYIPNARIGIIQGTTFDTEDKDIVLGMLQSISIKDTVTPSSFFGFSVCFIDEVHNISSEVFSRVMFKVRPRYVFGLTATLERKDGLHFLINWYLGDVLYTNLSNEKKQETEIHVYKYTGNSSVIRYLKDNKTVAMSQMLSEIAFDSERTKIIIKILIDLSRDKDRYILLLSDRISQLRYINTALPEISSLYIGSMKSDQLLKAKKSQILLATYKLASEGFSHDRLNCLFFATSRTSITQAVGRIYRKSHNITPVIVDIVDFFSFFKGQYYKRRKVYINSISKCTFVDLNKAAKTKVVGNFVSDSESETGVAVNFVSDSESDSDN